MADATGLDHIQKIELKVDTYPASNPSAVFVAVDNPNDVLLDDGACNLATGAFSHLLDTSIYASGTYRLIFRVTDKLNGFQYVTKLIRISKEAASFAMISPQADDKVAGEGVAVAGTLNMPHRLHLAHSNLTELMPSELIRSIRL